MIEAKLKKWIEDEIEHRIVSPACFSKALTDNDYAIDIWREFASWHRDELRESVRRQIKAILKKYDGKNR
jgi:hypothetical protein